MPVMDAKNGKGSMDVKVENEARKSKDGSVQPSTGTLEESGRTPKKRRKVNHACVYCRRSHMTCDLERPCTRCVKRNIGHLCHDEPREHENKKARGTLGASSVDDSETQSEMAQSSVDQGPGSMGPPPFENRMDQAAKSADFASPLLVQPQQPVPGIQASAVGTGNLGQFAGFTNPWVNQDHFHDMHNYHPNYMYTPEVHNEFNLLNEFLQNSILDEEALLPDNDTPLELGGGRNQGSALGGSGFLSSGSNTTGGPGGRIGTGLLSTSGTQTSGSALAPSKTSRPLNADLGKGISRPGSVVPIDKAGEYYLQAADPSGNDTPEVRMQRLLTAKFEAGLLKPFNYIKGYARLSAYLKNHIADSSRSKIIRQLDRFRPKFREKVHGLTDIELVMVEMWFEKTLMVYDRVFASMAIPACCWRRTGEIFRGNKEMAELINVPVKDLHDGKIALHEIMTEESMVRYWEEFGTIAFDPDHDTLLTACTLKNPDDKSKDKPIKCCFSLKIRRDDHDIPSLIVGNFLPADPPSD